MRYAKMLFTWAALFIPLVGFAANQEQATKDRMKSDLDTIRNVFDVQYAPKEWKQTYAGWDLDREIQKAKDKIQNTNEINVKKYQKIVSEFFLTPKDYHVGVYFHSTESATLPFSLKTVDERYFISYVDTTRLNQSIYPLFVGDELVMFDGKPVHEVVESLMNESTRHANESTDHSLAAIYLTHRSGRIGHKVPKGSIMIGIKNWDGAVKNHQLIWTYTPEKISNAAQGSLEKKKEKESSIFSNQSIFDKKMIMPQYEMIKDLFGQDKKNQILASAAAAASDSDSDFDDEPVEEERTIGSRKSFIPPLGWRIWWESSDECTFHAYIYETQDRKLIGYVRIPEYRQIWGASDFAPIINRFQERTDALIIDQVDNPGGNLLYMYSLLSMLTDQPLLVPKEKIMITQSEVDEAVTILPFLESIKSEKDAIEILGSGGIGMPVTYQMAQAMLGYFNFIISEWNAGKKLTDPYPILGIDRILPNPWVKYKKPILVLVNELDFSCGDFFPAILQDNKRATIFGSRTAGAGGCVFGTQFPNRFGIYGFSYTASIAERIDKKPIENLGITPDIEYQITAEDLQDEYSHYTQAIEAAVADLLNQ